MLNIGRIFTAFFIIISGLVVADERLTIKADQANDFECSVIVKSDIAEFYFSNEVSRYPSETEWNVKKGSAIEYSWFVYFDVRNTSKDLPYKGIDFGVRYFINKSGMRTGTIDQLVKDSDKFSFRYFDDGSFAPTYFEELSVEMEGLDLVLKLKKSDKTSFVFDLLPNEANFWVIVQGEMPRKCRSVIQLTD
jgi:hypothetical protein